MIAEITEGPIAGGIYTKRSLVTLNRRSYIRTSYYVHHFYIILFT